MPDAKSKGAQLKTNTQKKIGQPEKFALFCGFPWPTTWPNTKSKGAHLKTNTAKTGSAEHFNIMECFD